MGIMNSPMKNSRGHSTIEYPTRNCYVTTTIKLMIRPRGPIMQEEFIVCGKCRRDVPKTMYCIYCGSPLSEQEKKSKTRFAERKSREEGVDLFRPEQAPDIRNRSSSGSLRTAMKR
jgi:hypothetical protein